jgi:hypothetical protein
MTMTTRLQDSRKLRTIPEVADEFSFSCILAMARPASLDAATDLQMRSGTAVAERGILHEDAEPFELTND